MKYFLFLVLLGGMVSCNSGGEVYKRQPTDTIRTLAIYKTNEPRYDILFRVGKDSLIFVDVDSTVKKKSLSRWFDYYYPVPKLIVDSTNKPILDSAGNKRYFTSYDFLPKENLIKDFNINIDSLLKIHSSQK